MATNKTIVRYVLAALKPGEVSRPFRTPYGFHILKRYPPPPEQQVAGERIVIDGADKLRDGAKVVVRSENNPAQIAPGRAPRSLRGFGALRGR